MDVLRRPHEKFFRSTFGWESKAYESTGGRAEIELPIILPLVVYHDKGKWDVKKTLGEMIPNFEYLLFDLSEIDREHPRKR